MVSRTLLFGVVAALALTAAPAAAQPVASTAPPFTVPATTGRYQVGTTDLHLVDQGRTDPFVGGPRELMVTVSYPARVDRRTPRAHWLGPGLNAELDAMGLGIAPGAVDWERGDRAAWPAAPAAPVPGGLPVVLFSPGYGGPREVYSATVDDLASHGYLVVSMSHTYETAFVGFPGGRVARAVPYEETEEFRKRTIDTRIADTRFVLDQITHGTRLPSGVRPDLTRVGAYGHSYGGYTAAEALHQDRRFDAGINMDGAMAYGFDPYRPGDAVTHDLARPFLLMGSGLDPADPDAPAHTHRPDSADRTWPDFWATQRGWKRDVLMPAGTHLTFVDIAVLLPQLGDAVPQPVRRQFIGDMSPLDALSGLRGYPAAFFDLHLRGVPTGVFDRALPGFQVVR